MSKNFKNKLIGQIGEHLAVAELGRRAIIATPFSGNVPDIDVVAYANGHTISVQVKTITSGTWQLNLRNFLEIELVGKRQIIKGKLKGANRNQLFILIRLGKAIGEDRFYITKMGFIQDKIAARHTAYLARNNGMRRKNPESMHTIVSEKDLLSKRDQWQLILKALKFRPK